MGLDQRLIAAATSGDAAAFSALVERHRAELQVHAYRMLGSLEDAQDAVQDALLRAWRSRATYDGRSTFRAWLYRITTNACLRILERRPRRLVPYEEGPAAELGTRPLPPADLPWLQPYPDLLLDEGPEPGDAVVARETIELAFLTAIQHLPPRQRAVLILREVLRWKAEEVAELLDTSTASVNSALQRARSTLASRDVTVGSAKPLDDDQRALLGRYVAAFEQYDMDALTSLLHEDATWSMPPYELWLQTHRDIRSWCLGPGIGCQDSRLVATMANGMPAFGQYKPAPDGGWEPWSLQVVEIAGDQISGITFFLDTARFFPLFGLPPRIEA